MSVLFDPHGGIISYGRLKRLVPPEMRLALTARDHGCSFPGRNLPPWRSALAANPAESNAVAGKGSLGFGPPTVVGFVAEDPSRFVDREQRLVFGDRPPAGHAREYLVE
jgi:hypothetical protein